MWQRASTAQRWALVVGVAVLVLAALNLWWIETHRGGYPFDIDEAGYTAFGLADYLGLKGGGLQGWWNSIQAQPTFAPLVPALTSLTVFVHPGILNGFLILSAFLVVLVMASYLVAQRLVSPRLAALAALVTATLPGAFAFSREYVYALPVAALLVCAVYALMRSDGLQRRRWAIACGAAIGLMLLARTMAITYVPGVLVAALVVLLARRQGDLARRFLNLGLVIVAAVVVAATWYVRNLQSVIDYLTDYGYGRQSQFYGNDHALISLARFRSVAERTIAEDLFLPLAIVLLAGLVAIAAVLIQRLRRANGRGLLLQHLAGTDALSVAIVFVVGYGGLMTSQNGGDGFTFPLAVLLPPLAALALRKFPGATKPAVVAVALIAALNLVSTATIWSAASQTRKVSIPGISEELPVIKGVPKAVFAIRGQIRGPETVFDAGDAEWPIASEKVADALSEIHGPAEEAPVIAFASRNRALNTNTVNLASIAKYHRGLPLLQFEADPRDSTSVYTNLLTDPELGEPSVLITMSRNTEDFPPVITQSYAETAAKQLGFRKVHTLRVPDGRSLYIWQKGSPPD
jgi:hypothetical protein